MDDVCGPLAKAVLANDTETVKRLLANGAEEGDKFCALNFAIDQGFVDLSRVNIKIVKLLLAAKTNVNAVLMLPTDYLVDDSLLTKASLLGSATLVQLLLEAGADAASKGSALERATSENNLEIVKLLLAKGVEDTAKSEAISRAINAEHFEMAELLLSAEAKIKAKDKGYNFSYRC